MDKARSLLREKHLVAETDSKHVIIPNSDEYSEGKKGITPGGGDLGPAKAFLRPASAPGRRRDVGTGWVMRVRGGPQARRALAWGQSL